MSKPMDLTGQRFTRLVAISPARMPSGQTAWLCRCDCGKESVVSTGNLRTGMAKSCGCLRRERAFSLAKTHARKIAERKTTHGHSSRSYRSGVYTSWRNMWIRCTSKAHKQYHRYGGRGIKVCERWKDFAAFLADVGDRPDGMTLDRYPNPDGNYEPSNVRWATAKQQANNKSKSGKVAG